MLYSLPYIVVLTLFGACAVYFDHIEDTDKKKYATLFAITLFFIFFGFRGYVFTDWISYAKMMEDVTFGDIFQLTTVHEDAVVHEPGFTLLCWLCSLITRDYVFFVVVVTVIDLWLYLRFLKQWNVDNVAFSFMLLMAFEGIGIMFNLMRNQIAIFIFMNSLVYIVNRKPWQYMGCCLLALSFHLSSIVLFPLYFVLHRKTNKWVFLGIFIAFFLFYISQQSIVATGLQVLGLGGMLGEKAELYTTFFSTSRALSITGTIEKFGLVTLIFLFYDKLNSNVKNFQVLVNCLLLYFFCYYVLAEFKTLSSRMSYIFVFPYWVVWIYIIKVMAIPNNKRLLAGVLYLYSVYMLALNISTPVQQYDNVLFGAKSQNERLRILQSTYEDNE